MKNFLLARCVVAGVNCFAIETKVGRVKVNGVEQTNRTMISGGLAELTVKTYISALAKYLDFVVEYISCLLLFGSSSAGVDFEYILDKFFESLSVGGYSEDQVLAETCRRLNKRPVKRRTINVYRSALLMVFQVADKYEDAEVSLFGLDSGFEPFKFTRRVKLKGYEISRLESESFLAGCIRGSVSSRLVNQLPKYYRGSAKHFVGELRLKREDVLRAIPLIKNLRDRCVITLLAAGGMRISECLQLLQRDIDTKKLKVFLRDPRDRLAVYYEMGLSVTQVNSLRWKGRSRPEVFMVEPFATMFWRYYAEYLVSKDYPIFDANGLWIAHEFVFCLQKGRTKGLPLCFGDEGLIRKSFKRLFEKVGVECVAPHDLRHCYVSFVANELETPQGKGEGVEKTSKIVGHVNPASTAVYDHFNQDELTGRAEEAYRNIGYHPEMLSE
ncbi:integrase [Pseudomonas sp. OG7]|uniref:tyrosine-type recombinase/integrase n=1 Tax=Pseudomonas sp. OG7 TaxID=2587037 RepID=UPI0016095101|nr:site-specific integrase [Pseudomonas sp. OG7]MBB3271770.1 integrase [Pseudomonas sp. OG7]